MPYIGREFAPEKVQSPQNACYTQRYYLTADDVDDHSKPDSDRTYNDNLVGITSYQSMGRGRTVNGEEAFESSGRILRVLTRMLVSGLL